jgi:hypothetical protein
MATDEPMEIPDPPFMVMRGETSGKLDFEVGPCETLEEAVAQVHRCPRGGDYVITEHGKIVWPETAANRYS